MHSLSYSTVRIPRSIVNEMRENGAIIIGTHNRPEIHMNFGDLAWNVYERWVKTIHDGSVAIVRGEAGGTDSDVGAVIIPPHLYLPVHWELSSLIADFAALEVSDIDDDFRFVPGPIQAQLPMRNIDPKLILSPFFKCIQYPTMDYPALYALQPGTLICSVILSWTGALVTVKVFKSMDTIGS